MLLTVAKAQTESTSTSTSNPAWYERILRGGKYLLGGLTHVNGSPHIGCRFVISARWVPEMTGSPVSDN